MSGGLSYLGGSMPRWEHPRAVASQVGASQGGMEHPRVGASQGGGSMSRKKLVGLALKRQFTSHFFLSRLCRMS